MFIPTFDEVQVDYQEGSEQMVKLHDGPIIKLKKLDRDYDPTNRWGALQLLEESRARREFITGLLYINEKRQTLHELMRLTETPLAQLPEEHLRPSREAFDSLMKELM